MPPKKKPLPRLPRDPVQPLHLASSQALARIEKDWLKWLLLMFPRHIVHQFGAHHIQFWEWVWAIEEKKRPKPWISLWPRGGAKSASAEMAIAALGARGKRKYFIYCSESQGRADGHVQSIADILESEEMAAWYPGMADRAVGKFGQWKGWRRNRLHTRSGFIVDALGLDVASRGMKVDVHRPDGLLLDDIDDHNDAPETVASKIEALTRRILPATTNDAVIIGIQNLIHTDSVFAQIADRRAEFLSDRILSGPIPAIADLTYETQHTPEGVPRTVITGGTPTWAGLDIEACQNEIAKEGITVFLSELQHEVIEASGGMFDHVTYRHCTPDEVPQLDKIVCWVDPAVTERKESDSCGIQIDGLSRDGTLYRLYSWEERSGPLPAIKHALRMALHHGAGYVGIETDQGGDTWRDVFVRARESLGPEYAHLTMRARKAGQGYGSKVHRASQMLSDYEKGMIVHVEGTHHILERALIRFPRTPPLDLVDACIAEDIPVLTDEGWVSIQDVKVGAAVLTRSGWQRVRTAGRTGKQRKVYRLGDLWATENHPIWTQNRGWVPLLGLRYDDMVVVCESERKWSTRAVSTLVTLTRNNGIIGPTTPASLYPAWGRYIDTSMRTLAEQFQQECTSIMPTMTPITTIPQTWLPFLRANIAPSTEVHGRIGTRCFSTLPSSERRLPTGTVAMREESGIANMENVLGMGANPNEFAAWDAVNGSGLDTLARLSDAPLAAIVERPKPTVSLREPAPNVGRSSPSRNTDYGPSVRDLVQVAEIYESHISDVFNLEVEGDPEFVAAGVLVHNSVWAWNDLRRYGRPASLSSAGNLRLTGTHPAPLAVPSGARNPDPRGRIRLVPMPKR